jgi:hypothetical protein
METLRLQEYPTFETPQKLPTSYNPQQSIETAINNIFPLASEENKTSRMRKALGNTAQSLSNEQIETITTEFQFLIDSWIDEFEKEVFSGLTLKEVLNES